MNYYIKPGTSPGVDFNAGVRGDDDVRLPGLAQVFPLQDIRAFR